MSRALAASEAGMSEALVERTLEERERERKKKSSLEPKSF